MSLALTRNVRVMRHPHSDHEWVSAMMELARYVPSEYLLTYTSGVAMTPDLRNGEWVRLTITNNVAWTINAPKGSYVGQRVEFTIRNTSGGALGAATWNGSFKFGAAWASPATGFSRSIQFRYDGTNWVEVGRTAADVAN